MPTENTYQSIPSLRKIEIEYLAWQITRMQGGYPGIYRAKGSAPPFREAERGKMGLGR